MSQYREDQYRGEHDPEGWDVKHRRMHKAPAGLLLVPVLPSDRMIAAAMMDVGLTEDEAVRCYMSMTKETTF